MDEELKSTLIRLSDPNADEACLYYLRSNVSDLINVFPEMKELYLADSELDKHFSLESTIPNVFRFIHSNQSYRQKLNKYRNIGTRFRNRIMTIRNTKRRHAIEWGSFLQLERRVSPLIREFLQSLCLSDPEYVLREYSTDCPDFFKRMTDTVAAVLKLIDDLKLDQNKTEIKLLLDTVDDMKASYEDKKRRLDELMTLLKKAHLQPDFLHTKDDLQLFYSFLFRKSGLSQMDDIMTEALDTAFDCDIDNNMLRILLDLKSIALDNADNKDTLEHIAIVRQKIVNLQSSVKPDSVYLPCTYKCLLYQCEKVDPEILTLAAFLSDKEYDPTNVTDCDESYKRLYEDAKIIHDRNMELMSVSVKTPANVHTQTKAILKKVSTLIQRYIQSNQLRQGSIPDKELDWKMLYDSMKTKQGSLQVARRDGEIRENIDTVMRHQSKNKNQTKIESFILFLILTRLF